MPVTTRIQSKRGINNSDITLLYRSDGKICGYQFVATITRVLNYNVIVKFNGEQKGTIALHNLTPNKRKNLLVGETINVSIIRRGSKCSELAECV